MLLWLDRTVLSGVLYFYCTTIDAQHSKFLNISIRREIMNTSPDRPTDSNAPLSGIEIMRQFLPTSPFVGHLGIRLVEIQPGVATLSMPFADSLITIGTTLGRPLARCISALFHRSPTEPD